MKLILLILIFISSDNFAKTNCTISSYPHIYQISSSIGKAIITKSTCSKETQNHFIDFISNTRGTFNSSILNTNVQMKEWVEIEPSSITIYDLKTLLNRQIGNELSLFTSIKSPRNKSFLFSHAKNPLIEFKCSNCSSPGKKNIQFVIDDRVNWIKTNLKTSISGFQAKDSISYSSPLLHAKDFKKVTILSDEQSHYFTDIDNIQFFRPTKNIRPNEMLKMNHLTPKTIISRGQKIRVYIKNKLVNLSTIGIAMKSGSIGEYIEVQNPKSKKTTLAKIVDYNKVHIEL